MSEKSGTQHSSYFDDVIKNLDENYKLKKLNLKKLELRLSNKCDLKCRMCEHECSSSWGVDYEKIHNVKIKKNFKK